MRVPALVALLAAALLAGCASPEPAADDFTLEDGTTIDLDEGTSDTRGAIAGVVVDPAIRPLEGVTFRLADGRAATSDANGFFRLADLEPGFYAVTVTAPGFLASQTSADVVAGETATVRVQLLPDVAPVPYHQTYPFEAYMQAWGTVAQWAVEIFAPTPLCKCTYTIEPGANVTDLVIEAFWEGTVADPLAMSEFYWEAETPGADWLESGYCTSPCHAKPSLDGYEQGQPILVRISGPDAYVAYQQKVNLYTTVFHHGPAPEGFSVDGPITR